MVKGNPQATFCYCNRSALDLDVGCAIWLDATLFQTLRQAPVRSSTDGVHVRRRTCSRDIATESSIDEIRWEAVGEDVADVLRAGVVAVQSRDELGVLAT